MIVNQVSGLYRTFSTIQIGQALAFVPTHEWRASENVVVSFDRVNGRCHSEEEAQWHFEFLNKAVRVIEAGRESVER